MCDQQSLRPACAYAQSDQSLCLSLEYSLIVKLLTEHHLDFLSLKGNAEARPSLHMSKYHIVGNHMHWLSYCLTFATQHSSGNQLYFRIKLSALLTLENYR